MIVDITTALTERLYAFSASAPLPVGSVPIAWLGRSFDPPAGESSVWIENVTVDEDSVSGFLSGQTAIRRGRLEIVCVTRSKRASAEQAVKSLAQQLVAHFPNAAIYRSNAVAVQIARPARVWGARDEDGKLRQPVTVYWQAMN